MMLNQVTLARLIAGIGIVSLLTLPTNSIQAQGVVDEIPDGETTTETSEAQPEFSFPTYTDELFLPSLQGPEAPTRTIGPEETIENSAETAETEAEAAATAEPAAAQTPNLPNALYLPSVTMSGQETPIAIQANAPCPSSAPPIRTTSQAMHREMLQIPLTAKNQYGNPYTAVTVNATFHGPNNVQKKVKGFWNGGQSFLVRFTPTVAGSWTYSISSSPADAGLTKSGSFTAAAPSANSRGFVRQSPGNPYSFVYDSGARYFMMGQTYYEIVRTACATDLWKEGIYKSKGYSMNKLRMLVHGWGLSTGRKANYYPVVLPFINNDHNRLDIAYWKQLDEVVAFLASQNMVSELIIFTNSSLAFGTKAQDERYTRYVLARYAAFPNVMWSLTNEWEYTLKDKAYWDSIGALVHAEDAWSSHSNGQRLLSIHNKTGGSTGGKFHYFSSSWPTHAVIQYGVRNGRFSNGDQWGNYSIVQNHGKNAPVVNDEYGYIGETEGMVLTRSQHRYALWGIVVGGGYSAAGDSRTFADGPNGRLGRVVMTGRWHDAAEYGDIKRMVQFWSPKNIPFWRMTPANHLITSGTRTYVLASAGQEYVVYSATGASFKVSLPSGSYTASWYDPRTGTTLTRPNVTGGTSVNFTKPNSSDWVLHLRRK